MARGSAMEHQSQLLNIRRLELVERTYLDQSLDLTNETLRLVTGLEQFLTRQIDDKS